MKSTLNNRKKSLTFPKSQTFTLSILCLILAACNSVTPQDNTPVPQANTSEPSQSSPQEQSGIALNTIFTLNEGQSVTLDATEVTLTFEMVEEDNRCPTNIECETAGPVIIIVTADQVGKPSTTFTMNPDPFLAAQDGTSSNIFHLKEYDIELVAINPYPEEPEDIMNMDYTADFIVTEPSLEEQKVIDAELRDIFTLRLEQDAVIASADITVTFEKVISDFRCPKAVECEEDGPVIVQISAETGDGTSATFEMNPEPGIAAVEGFPPTRVNFQGFVIELTAVHPDPIQPEDTDNFPYTATIIVHELDSAVISLNVPFILNAGQSKPVEGTDLTLTFEMVESDGRCPSAVLCVENGPVIIIISAVIGNQQPTTFTMNPNPELAQLPGIPPKFFTYEGFEIELIAVEPYPEQPEDLMNMDYTANFIVRQATSEVNYDIETDVGSPFPLEVMERAAIRTADFIITFEMVITDIRCPTAVDCFQDGPVIIQISVKTEDGTTTTFEMNPSPELAEIQGNPPNFITFQGYDIILIAVDPYPEQPEDIMNMDYRATLIVQ